MFSNKQEILQLLKFHTKVIYKYILIEMRINKSCFVKVVLFTIVILVEFLVKRKSLTDFAQLYLGPGGLDGVGRVKSKWKSPYRIRCLADIDLFKKALKIIILI